MLPSPALKIGVLIAEVKAARHHGPSGRLASVLSSDRDEVTMWDATSLVRELLPELSLHAERVTSRDHSQYFKLHYVLIRSTGDVVNVTESALVSWLNDNTRLGGEKQVETAILSIRQSKELKSLTQGSRNKVTKYLMWLESELRKASS